jgi:uncharacterized protein (TIGR02145 family)
MKKFININSKRIIIFSIFILTLTCFSEASENPYKKFKDKLIVINNEILNLTETYVYHYNNVDRYMKKYDEKAKEYNELFESEVEPKGEFEKQYDYDNRVNEKENKLRKLHTEVSELSNSFSEAYQYSNYALMMHIMKTYEHGLYSSIKFEVNQTLKLSDLSSYNSEKETFNVNLNGSTWEIEMPISIAPSFKEEYMNLDIYSLGTDYWVEYKNEWSRLINLTNPELFTIKMNDEEGNAFINKKSTELIDLAKKNENVESIILGESVLPNPSLFLDLSIPNNNTVIIAGKEYKTIRMGNQVWLAENLDYVPSNIHYSVTWTDKGNTYYNQNGLSATEKAIKDSGWHLPTKTEWESLMTYVDGNKRVYMSFNPTIVNSYYDSRRGRTINDHESVRYWTDSRYPANHKYELYGIDATEEKMKISEYTFGSDSKLLIRLVRDY